MTTDDQAGLSRIMTDYTGLRQTSAHNREGGAAEGRPFPARNAGRFICIEIIGWRGIGQADQPDIAEAIDRHQRFAPGARMPAGNTHQVPHQPWPEERPDMVEVALKVRMHAHKDGAERYQTNSDHLHGVIPENAKRLSGVRSCNSHAATGSRISPAGFPRRRVAGVGERAAPPPTSTLRPFQAQAPYTPNAGARGGLRRSVRGHAPSSRGCGRRQRSR
jgi:hypothetical protein